MTLIPATPNVIILFKSLLNENSWLDGVKFTPFMIYSVNRFLLFCFDIFNLLNWLRFTLYLLFNLSTDLFFLSLSPSPLHFLDCTKQSLKPYLFYLHPSKLPPEGFYSDRNKFKKRNIKQDLLRNPNFNILTWLVLKVTDILFPSTFQIKTRKCY